MYDFLRGTVAAIDAAGHLTLEVGGVGYFLRISAQTRRHIPLDGRVITIYVRLLVKEDDMVLFGFIDAAERSAFDLLTSVQMVGPALAMAVLSNLGVVELRRALLTRDIAALKAIKGVGQKSAERIAMELADRVERIPAPLSVQPNAPAGSQQSDEALRALVVLGFDRRKAGDALASVTTDGISAEELLRLALAILR
jgi:Holliday junction DNA helicase RuvA